MDHETSIWPGREKGAKKKRKGGSDTVGAGRGRCRTRRGAGHGRTQDQNPCRRRKVRRGPKPREVRCEEVSNGVGGGGRRGADPQLVSN